MTDFVEATDAILGAFKTQWDADTPAVVSGSAPTIVYEATESDLKPHPRDGTKPWTRIVIRHGEGLGKVTLANANGLGRFRRNGVVWVQVFTPATNAAQWTLGQQLAKVAQKAFEGKRSANRDLAFWKSSIQDRPKDGPFFTFDIKTYFTWDEIR